MISNIPTFQDGDSYLECILKQDGHEYVSLGETPQQISENIISESVICISCGHKDNVYQYIYPAEEESI
jgi:hypothetical protein